MTNVKKGQVDFYFIFDKKNIPVFFDNENQNILEYVQQNFTWHIF